MYLVWSFTAIIWVFTGLICFKEGNTQGSFNAFGAALMAACCAFLVYKGKD